MPEPRWCDLTCKHAAFPEADALSGACNTLSTLFCKKYRKLVQKNAPCLDVRNTEPDSEETPPKSN